MAKAATHAHIEAQARLRNLTQKAVGEAWRSMPLYDGAHLDEWLASVLPIVKGAQQASVHLTDGFMAQAQGRAPLGVDPEKVVSGLRNGQPAEAVWQRPLGEVWERLGKGEPVAKAIEGGGARAANMAANDVQMAMRGAAQEVQNLDDSIFGFERVADAGACEFCQEIAGAYTKSADAAPLHPHCGCGLEPLDAPHPKAVFLPSGESVSEFYSVQDHPELGSVLEAGRAPREVPPPAWVKEGEAKFLADQNDPQVTAIDPFGVGSRIPQAASAALQNFDAPHLYADMQTALREPEKLVPKMKERWTNEVGQLQPPTMWTVEGDEFDGTIEEAAVELTRQAHWLDKASREFAQPAPAEGLWRVTGMDHFSQADLAALDAGQEVIASDPGFLAATPSLDFATMVATRTARGKAAVWRIKGARALLSEHTPDEWLFPPGTRFSIRKAPASGAATDFEVTILP